MNRRTFFGYASFGAFVGGVIGLALLVTLAGCPSDYAPLATPTAELTAHQHACVAKGEVMISHGLMLGLPCPYIEAELRELVRNDEDCLAFYGDAGVSVDLCTPDRDSSWGSDGKDAGIDGSD